MSTALKCIAIADDFTGAAEVAGSSLRLGLDAEVHLGELCPTNSDVVVVDAASRSLSPALAAAEVARLTDYARKRGPNLLFKKVDSLLRGPVLAEILAMRAAANLEGCLLVCGNPRKRRFVVNGQIVIDGTPLHETAFVDDPEHPCYASDAIELLKNGVGEELVASFGAKLDDFRVISPTDLTNALVSVGNVASAVDLSEYADRWFSHRHVLLAAGAAEFFEAVLQKFLRSQGCTTKDPSDQQAAFVSSGEILLISGTYSSSAQDWPTTTFDFSQPQSRLASDVCQSLAKHGRTAIFANEITAGSPAERLQFIREIARRVLGVCRPSQVWIEGGGTASAVLRDLGHQRLITVGNAADGVVALRAAGEALPLYLVKPGSYPWPEVGQHLEAPLRSHPRNPR
jgi:D-threonate/D-erythronate kinase